eukprot:TRINITY_DN15083_c0_g1_i1.p1 TRINITY_DN15083_c0_g1~~TRINITY_DN15083_c0_g1_i1.p1  ORF type:complete len:186 (+),score=16.63 TRINITY_DN15083_c0_g1_i1:108-665(+)
MARSLRWKGGRMLLVWPLAAVLSAAVGRSLSFVVGRVSGPSRLSSTRLPRAVEDSETMGELFTKYWRLQETNRQLEADTKVNVVGELLEVLDDLELAERALSSNGSAESNAVRSAADKLRRKLKSLGFSRIDGVGATFDPHLHEAAQRREAPAGQSKGEIVCDEMRSGWLFGDRVVRAAVVAVEA